MDLGLAGKTALVCASTGGLGAATARALAVEGVRVVFSGRRGDVAREAAAEFEGSAGIEADLTTIEGARALYASAVEAVGPLDILVLNGPGPRPATASQVSADDLSEAITTLLLVHQTLVGSALPHMLDAGWGRILAVGSSGVAAPMTGLALSNAGRSALAAYLKSLANEVAGKGVTVNLLLPGRIATDRLQSLDGKAAKEAGVSVEEIATKAAAAIPSGRYGRPEEFGDYAAFLCSALASYVTGTAARCDGGLIPTL
jgi:3-oxoacyl-[acyl-carrier protein] reductase